MSKSKFCLMSLGLVTVSMMVFFYGSALAISSGGLGSYCYDSATNTLVVSYSAVGDTDDVNGMDQYRAFVSAGVLGGGFVYQLELVPIDGVQHTKTFVFDLSGMDLSQGVWTGAEDVDAAGVPTSPPFLLGGTGWGNMDQMPKCASNVASAVYEAVPVPQGFEQRAITCETAVFSFPGGNPVAGAIVHVGQHWYVNPTPVLGMDGQQWTEIFVAGASTGYVPKACVAP